MVRYRRVNVRAQQGDPGSLLHSVRQMIRQRKAHPALGEGGLRWVEAGSPQVAAYLRTGEAGPSVLVVNNLSGEAQGEKQEISRSQQNLPTRSGSNR